MAAAGDDRPRAAEAAPHRLGPGGVLPPQQGVRPRCGPAAPPTHAAPCGRSLRRCCASPCGILLCHGWRAWVCWQRARQGPMHGIRAGRLVAAGGRERAHERRRARQVQRARRVALLQGPGAAGEPAGLRLLARPVVAGLHAGRCGPPPAAPDAPAGGRTPVLQARAWLCLCIGAAAGPHAGLERFALRERRALPAAARAQSRAGAQQACTGCLQLRVRVRV